MMHQQNPRFPFNTMAAPAATAPAPKPLDHQYSDGSPSGSGGGWFNIEPTRKKRGRPRKYSPDNSIGLGLSPAPVTQIASAVGHTDSGGGGGTHRLKPLPNATVEASWFWKKTVGCIRNAGSWVYTSCNYGKFRRGKLPMLDIASKIMAFSQQGPRTVCILSANGAICNVTLRQPAMSGGTVTYEGIAKLCTRRMETLDSRIGWIGTRFRASEYPVLDSLFI
ncbi:UNVERIFIED_CONTAM: AT-hook motif nuclear-localized protein 10 [Sesamum radiatum]|uniref:AT-hook motif nuclear-localized protein n=1 Tax=Sesamum radiatum TaxID=300843 RepID=A0AAW2JQG6_SESRA